jgi:4-hydroxybenzoate polyprenyltransferase
MARSTSSPPPVVVTSVNEVPGRPVALNLLISLRPGQWTKNLLVFAGLVFARRLFDPGAVAAAAAAFAIFCALSGVVYLVNDVVDRKSDRQHPQKARRPVASGRLAVATAIRAAIVVGTGGLVAAFFVNWRFGLVASLYVGLLALYSGPLKHIVIVDVLTIAIGFVLRAVAGAVAIGVAISHWLLVCTILLALFIVLAKRRSEIVLLADGAIGHRRTLGEYSPYLLDQMIAVVAASTLVAYIFYTISPEIQDKFGTPWLWLTIPFPLYGIFRYLYLVHQRGGGGSPSDTLVTDRPLLACVALWVLAVVSIIYWPSAL